MMDITPQVIDVTLAALAVLVTIGAVLPLIWLAGRPRGARPVTALVILALLATLTGWRLAEALA